MNILRAALIYNKMGSTYYYEVYVDVTPEDEKEWASLVRLLRNRVNSEGVFSVPYPTDKKGQREAKEALRKQVQRKAESKGVEWAAVRGKGGFT